MKTKIKDATVQNNNTAAAMAGSMKINIGGVNSLRHCIGSPVGLILLYNICH